MHDCILKYVGVAFLTTVIFATACQGDGNDESDERAVVSPKRIFKGADQTLNIHGVAIFPHVYRDINCGSEAIGVDDDFVVSIRPLSGGKWITLENVGWDWDREELVADVPASIINDLDGWVSLEVLLPEGEPVSVPKAFEVVSESETDSNPVAVETDSPTDTSVSTDSWRDSGDAPTDPGDTATDTVTDTGDSLDTFTVVVESTDSDTEIALDTATDTGSDSDAASDSGETDVDTATTGADTESDTETDSDTETESDTESETVTETGFDTGTDSDTLNSSLSYCNEVPALAAYPEIDGILEAGLALEFVTPVGWDDSVGPIPDGNRMYYAVSWRNTGIYFFVKVVDPNRNPPPFSSEIWEGDGVEIYLDYDGVYDPPETTYDVGTREIGIAAPSNGITPSTRAYVWTTPGVSVIPYTGTQWSCTPTPDGYVIEMVITAADLGLARLDYSAGDTIGFDLAHNVSVGIWETGSEGNRLSRYYLRIREPALGNDDDFPWNNETAFCTATLLPLQ